MDALYYDTIAHGPVRMGARIVYTAGTFDILHQGHLNLIRRCRAIAGKDGIVCVGVNSDAFVKSYRGTTPVMHEWERRSVIGALRDVNTVLSNGDPQQRTMEYAFAIGEHRNFDKFLVVGSDWAAKDYYAQIGVTREWLDDNNITLCYVPYTQGISSTEIRWRMSRS